MKRYLSSAFAITITIFILILGVTLPAQASQPPDTNTFSCADVTEIPQAECEALVALYNSTNGDGWIYKGNWLITNTPSDWYDVTVTSGHVTALTLGGNNLNGTTSSRAGESALLENHFTRQQPA